MFVVCIILNTKTVDFSIFLLYNTVVQKIYIVWLLVVDNQQSNTLNITLMLIKNREKQQKHKFQKQIVFVPFAQ